MALSNEEREQLFEIITNSETLEDRAEAIAQLKGELDEETRGRNEINAQYEDVTSKYLDTQTKLKQAISSIPLNHESVFAPKHDGDSNPQPDEPELRGFAQLRT